jgi:hypothetical protein
MKFKVIFIILLLIILTVNVKVIYAQETGKISETAKLAEDLCSDDANVRDGAIDEILSEGIDTIADAIRNSRSDDRLSEEDERFMELALGIFTQIAHSPAVKGKLKESINEALSDSDTREIVVPVIGIFLEILKEKAAKNNSLHTDYNK